MKEFGRMKRILFATSLLVVWRNQYCYGSAAKAPDGNYQCKVDERETVLR